MRELHHQYNVYVLAVMVVASHSSYRAIGRLMSNYIYTSPEGQLSSWREGPIFVLSRHMSQYSINRDLFF